MRCAHAAATAALKRRARAARRRPLVALPLRESRSTRSPRDAALSTSARKRRKHASIFARRVTPLPRRHAARRIYAHAHAMYSHDILINDVRREYRLPPSTFISDTAYALPHA